MRGRNTGSGNSGGAVRVKVDTGAPSYETDLSTLGGHLTAQDLGTRLTRVQEQIEFEQVDFARIIGTNPRTISRWMSGESQPRPDARLRLLEVIHVLELLSSVLRGHA